MASRVSLDNQFTPFECHLQWSDLMGGIPGLPHEGDFNVIVSPDSSATIDSIRRISREILLHDALGRALRFC